VKAYRFRLESVLRVRLLQERVAMQQLAEARRALHNAQSESARARRSLEDEAAPVGRLTIGAFEWSHEQSTRLADASRARAEAAEAAAEAARQADAVWGTAKRRTATLERLDERHLALWRRELDRSEAAELDDLATKRTAADGALP
jgi:flagellar export protein FliJ